MVEENQTRIASAEAPVLPPSRERRNKRRRRPERSDDPDRLLPIQEAAAILGVTPATVRKLVREQGLRYVKVGREWRFKRAWITEWADRNSHQSGTRGGRR